MSSVVATTARRWIDEATGGLPLWASSLVAIGSWLYAAELRNESVHLCLSLPTRSLAAAFVAMGASLESMLKTERQTVDEHYRDLCNAPPKSPVVVFKSGALRSGWLEGPTTVMGYDCIAYVEKTHGGEVLSHLFVERCRDIQLMPESAELFAVERHPFTSADSAKALDAVEMGLSGVAATQFDDSVALITVATKFQEEMEQIIEVGGVELPLVDVVRPNRFVSSGIPFRTTVIPSVSIQASDVVAGFDGIAIFDGAQGFLRLRHEFERHSSVLLLDRWSGASRAAAEAFVSDNAPYGDQLDLTDLEFAAGVEALGFEGDW